MISAQYQQCFPQDIHWIWTIWLFHTLYLLLLDSILIWTFDFSNLFSLLALQHILFDTYVYLVCLNGCQQLCLLSLVTPAHFLFMFVSAINVATTVTIAYMSLHKYCMLLKYIAICNPKQNGSRQAFPPFLESPVMPA